MSRMGILLGAALGRMTLQCGWVHEVWILVDHISFVWWGRLSWFGYSVWQLDAVELKTERPEEE